MVNSFLNWEISHVTAGFKIQASGIKQLDPRAETSPLDWPCRLKLPMARPASY